ncbi:MAG: hypothetical protein K2P09_05800, partial [Erysipelotrichales bacterium]|nr:hypothetical protein [Erysipelotrichales bacterium]
LTPQEACVIAYEGIFDGQGHTVRNFRLDTSPSYSTIAGYLGYYRSLFMYFQGGTMKNVTFDNMSGSYLQSTIYNCVNKYILFDHVYVKNFINDENSQVPSSARCPFIVSISCNADIQNCGVIDSSIKNLTAYSSSGVGGLYVTGGTGNRNIRNTFVKNFHVDLPFGASYASAFVAQDPALKEVENCYVSGSVSILRGDLSAITRGSIVNVKNTYTDVDLQKTVYHSKSWTNNLSGVVLSGRTLENVLSVGDLKNRLLLEKFPPKRIGDVSTKINVYAADFQRLNGKIEPDNKSDAKGLLSYEELILEDTYRNKIQLGDSFDYSYVKNGHLPILKDTDGKVMPYQEQGPILFERRFEKDVYLSDIEVNEVTETSGGTIQATLKGLPYDAQTKIKSVKFKNDELTAKDMKIGSSPSGETIMTMDTELRKAYDSYYITEVVYEYKGQEYTLNCYEEVMMRLYHNIDSVERWKQLNNKKDYENYMITKDLDFENVSSADIGHAHNINRLVGQDIDGNKPVIKNIDLQLEGENLGADDAGLIKNLYAEMSNLKFENCSLYVERAPLTSTNLNYRGVGKRIGFIVILRGVVTNVELNGIDINQSKDENNPQVIGTNTGFVAYSQGNIENIKATNVKVTGYSHVGSVVGYSDGITEHCQLENIKVQGAYCVGGFGGIAVTSAGYNRYLKLNNVITEAVPYISKADVIYFGGAFGQGGLGYGELNNITVNVVNINPTNPNNTSYVGGVSGFYATIKNTKISDLTINAPTSKYVGGIVGDQGFHEMIYCYIKDSHITGKTYVGGIAGYKHHNGNVYKLQYNVLENIDVEAVNGVAGGVLGYTTHYPHIYYNTIKDVRVTANGSDGVKGIAGGIVGELTSTNAAYAFIHDNIGNVEIKASDIAGGIVGRLYANANIDGKSTHNIYRNIILADIQTTNSDGYAGGLFGVRTYATGQNLGWHPEIDLASNILAGSINGANASPTIGNETTIEHFYNTMVHNSTRVNGLGVVDEGDILKVVDKETLMEHDTYLNIADKYSTAKYVTTYWQLLINGKTDGHFPQQVAPKNVYIGYGDGMNANSGIPLQNIVNGIYFEIPENDPASIMKFGDDLATMPEVSVYSSGVDTLN